MSLTRVLRRSGEDGLLAHIVRRFGRLAPRAPLGIGDDAALMGVPAGSPVTTDCLIEDRHFLRSDPPRLLGRKALAVNLSDLAAMGAKPEAFLLVLGIPDGLPGGYLEELLEGLLAAARRHRVALIGGDTSSSPYGLVITITAIGRAWRGRVLRRSGARPGDGIYVSGPLGAAATGRLLLARGWRARLDRRSRDLAGLSRPPSRRGPVRTRAERTRALEAVRSTLDPEPRLGLGALLVKRSIASAAIDLSDGLSTDLARLVSASRVGARLMAPAVPIHDSARSLGRSLGRDPLDLALSGGEDYELLFTVPPRKEAALVRIGLEAPGEEALLVGRITPRSSGLVLAGPSGRERRLSPAGFDHFKVPRSR